MTYIMPLTAKCLYDYNINIKSKTIYQKVEGGNMKKKFLAALLSCAMLASMLTGCGASDDAASVSDKETVAEADDEDDAEEADEEEADDAEDADDMDAAAAAIAERKAEAEATGEYPKIVISWFDWTGAPAGIDRINATLSEYTREKYGCDVELLIIDSAAYVDDIKLMLSSGEQVDLFSTCAVGYTTCINNDYLYDLEEDDLLDTYGAKIHDVVRQNYLDACRFGGTLYGVPPIKDYAIQTAAIIIGKEYLDGIGYDYDGKEKDNLGFVKSNFDEITDIYTQLHEKYPDKYVYAIQDNTLTQGASVDNIAGDYYGTLLDPANSLKVEDVYASDLFKEWCERTYAWNQAGFISKDALADDTGASARVKSGAYMSMMSCGKPGYITQITGECGRDVVVFNCGESFMAAGSVSSFPWCMNQNTEDPVLAMQILEAMYTDSFVSDILLWGMEGYEYQVLDDGTIDFADGITPDNSEYYPNVTWMMPNPYVAHVWHGDPLDIGTQMAAFNDDCANKSKALGFTWDNSEYAAEFTALQNAYKEFGTTVTYGFVEPEKGIADLEAALKDAGLDKYIEAKQAALDAWAAENGVQ